VAGRDRASDRPFSTWNPSLNPVIRQIVHLAQTRYDPRPARPVILENLVPPARDDPSPPGA
jgi:hypothetical protein